MRTTAIAMFALVACSSPHGSNSNPDAPAGDGAALDSLIIVGPTPTLTFSPSTLTFGSETVGMTTTTQLITATNTGPTALPIVGVAMGGASAAEFTATDDCPAQLAVNASCHVRVVFSPAGAGARPAAIAVNGMTTAAVTGTGLALADAFYVATAANGGNDGNPGTLASPFLTLTRAQSAMRASGGAKLTTYVRAGTYSPAGQSGCLVAPCGLILSGADDNETWATYPPDGVDTAILDGGASKPATGLGSIIYMGGASNITIRALQFQHCDWTCISGDGASHITIFQNLFHDGYYGAAGTPGGSQPEGGPDAEAGAVGCIVNCADWTIANNAAHDFAGFGFGLASGQTLGGGSIAGLVMSGNVLYNICTGFADCAPLYCEDQAGGGSCTMTNNFVRDGNPAFAGYAGYGAAFYLDGCASNSTISGNVATGVNGSETTIIHGGYGNTIAGNIFDYGTAGHYVVMEQTNGPCDTYSDMRTEVLKGNVVLSRGGGGGYWGNGSLPSQPTISNGDYFAYTGATPSHGPVGGVSATDTNPQNVDPQFTSCASYELAADSPVYTDVVGFAPLVMGWGPPGYKIPATGSAPSCM